MHRVLATLVCGDILSQTEVSKYKMTIFVQKYVIWLDVTVDNTDLVEAMDGENLNKDSQVSDKQKA